MKLKSFLNYFSSREKGLAVSILLPTHRTFPDNKQDAIMLKNLVTEARNRLQSWPDRQEAETIMEAIDKKSVRMITTTILTVWVFLPTGRGSLSSTFHLP